MIKLSTSIKSPAAGPYMASNFAGHFLADIQAYPSEDKNALPQIILGIVILVSCIISFFIIKSKRGKSR